MSLSFKSAYSMSTGGVLTINLTAFMNPALAATFAGATVAGVVTNPNAQQVSAAITLTPGAPLTLQVVETDAGGSQKVYGGTT